MHPILDPNLTLLGGLRTSPLERLEGDARVKKTGEDLRPGEIMVVVSKSGINALPLEVALAAKEAGLRLRVGLVMVLRCQRLPYEVTERAADGYAHSRPRRRFAEVAIGLQYGCDRRGTPFRANPNIQLWERG